MGRIRMVTAAAAVCLLLLLTGVECQRQNNAPEWINPLQVRLQEEGLDEDTQPGDLIGTLYATDRDGDRVYYSTTSTDFLVDRETGEVTLRTPFDREEIDPEGTSLFTQIEVTFIAEDNRGNRVPITFPVTITDVNDNAPVFEGVPYYSKISEFAGRGAVVKSDIIVTDRDAADNSRISLTCYTEADQEAAQACEMFTVAGQQTSQGRYQGIVTLKGKLDHSQKPFYTMTIMAADAGVPRKSTLVNLVIEVTDEQDQGPLFTNAPLTIVVLENTQVGQVVGSLKARDQDTGNPNPISMAIVEDSYGLFALGPSRLDTTGVYTSEILVAGTIDREAFRGGSYLFQATASEIHPNGTVSEDHTQTVVVVNIQDQNDNTPTFDKQHYNVTLDEGHSGPVNIRDLIVRDGDEGDNSAFAVELVDLRYPAFELSPTSGRGVAAITLISVGPEFMDYELPQYRTQIVKIKAFETNTLERLSSTATVTINLRDVNDNAPTFLQTSYEFTLSERMEVGDLVGKVSAEDPDKEGRDGITYAVSGEFSESFTITSTGDIRLSKPVDYEITGDVINLQIEASDAGGRSSVASVRLTVTDVNDETPTFQVQNYVTSVDETTTSLVPPITVRALDRDRSSSIVYTILSGNTADNAFFLNPISGELSLLRALLYKETTNGQYTLVIQARDDGIPSLTSTATITVNVNDINNYIPVFRPNGYVATISELAQPNSDVVRVFAFDEDSGEDGRIEYSIGTSQDNFYIEAANGMIKVKQGAILDLERAPSSYDLQVWAIDSGSPPKTGMTQVMVIIEDDNNQIPEFPVDLYRVTLSEDIGVSTSVLQVEAVDADSSADLRYSIKQTSLEAKDSSGQVISDLGPVARMFGMEERTGVIRTRAALSRDTAAQVSFTAEVRDVRAVDPPTTLQTATVSVIMNIRSTSGDIDFARPSGGVSDELSLTVREDATVGTPIGAIVAHNPSTGRRITNYVKAPGSDSQNYFSINRSTGTVSLARGLDYEQGPRTLTMDVLAYTADTPPQSADVSITVQVLDVNDNRPVFEQQKYEFRISEGLRYPGQFGIVVATDADSGRYGNIQYGLSGPSARFFSIDPARGYLSVRDGVRLDREQTPTFDLIITATDNPSDPSQAQSLQQSTTTTARVILLDENDNAPEFSLQEYYFSALQDSAVGAEIGTVRAVDGDVGANGRVRYYIVDDPTGGLFGINPDSGVLFTRRDLSSTPDLVYPLTVEARDGGYPTLSGRARVSVAVDNPVGYDGRPRFLFPLDGTVVNVPENLGVGGNVTRVVVQGPQDGSRWLFRFLPTGSDDEGHFRIDGATGIITVTRMLDREQKADYELSVEVSDRTNPTVEPVVRRLTVSLTDQDDNPPRLVGCPGRQGGRRRWEVAIPEGEAVGLVVPGLRDLRGCDADASPNNRVFYFITCGNEADKEGVVPFFIDRSSGIITTQISLDRETRSQYELCVTVNADPNFSDRFKDIPSDASLQGDDTTVKVIVKVTDKNDNVANFAAQTNGNAQIAAITSSVPYHTELYRLYVLDPDSTVDSMEYQIESTHFNLGLRDSRATPGAFTINRQTGSIYTNMPTYRDYERGRFILKVSAINSQKIVEDEIDLTVYVVREDEQYKYVFEANPADVKAREESFFRDIVNTLGDTQIQMYPTRYYHSVFPNGTVNLRRTELCFHIVNHREQELVGRADAFQLLSLSRADLQPIYTNYGVKDLAMCSSPYTTKTWSDQYWAWWLLIALAILLFIMALLLIICIVCIWNKYRSRLTRYKPYVVLDPYELPYKQEYEWQETTVKMG